MKDVRAEEVEDLLAAIDRILAAWAADTRRRTHARADAGRLERSERGDRFAGADWRRSPGGRARKEPATEAVSGGDVTRIRLPGRGFECIGEGVRRIREFPIVLVDHLYGTLVAVTHKYRSVPFSFSLGRLGRGLERILVRP
jgi:hypothetical protein